MKKLVLSAVGALFLLFAGSGCAVPLSEEPISPRAALNFSKL